MFPKVKTVKWAYIVQNQLQTIIDCHAFDRIIEWHTQKYDLIFDVATIVPRFAIELINQAGKHAT